MVRTLTNALYLITMVKSDLLIITISFPSLFTLMVGLPDYVMIDSVKSNGQIRRYYREPAWPISTTELEQNLRAELKDQ